MGLVALVLGILAAISYVTHKVPAGAFAPTYPRAVHGGQKEQVEYFYDLRADCAIAGYPEITIVREPTQGTVTTEQGKGYPQFTRDNVRADCDKNPVGATLLFYQSKPGFHGRDFFTVKVRFADSALWTRSYLVDVW